jgi:D-sedoheptulose 7-phosphate isomerase
LFHFLNSKTLRIFGQTDNMIHQTVKASFDEARQVLDNYMSDHRNLELVGQAAQLIANALMAGGKVLSCGNGGSMSDAMHFAEELTGRFRGDRRSLAAIAIADATHITCTANDYGFDYIFSRYLEGVGNTNDVLLAISTSGNSTNVLNAAKTAIDKGMKVVSLTGKDGGKLKELSTINLNVAHFGYSDRIQEIHIKIIHIMIEVIEALVDKK